MALAEPDQNSSKPTHAMLN